MRKKMHIQNRSLEHTIEFEKQKKIKTNLAHLSNFVKSHLRHSSQNGPHMVL